MKRVLIGEIKMSCT